MVLPLIVLQCFVWLLKMYNAHTYPFEQVLKLRKASTPTPSRYFLNRKQQRLATQNIEMYKLTKTSNVNYKCKHILYFSIKIYNSLKRKYAS